MSYCNDDEKKTVGIIGLGSVGWATVHSFYPEYNYCGYDIAGSYDFKKVLESDVIFICVPTPLSEEGRLDCTAVDTVLQRLADSGYHNCVVIKSTLRVGFMQEASEKYPNLRLIYLPEFLRERSSFTWCSSPDRIVISGSESDMDEVLTFFTRIPESVPRIKMSWESAEIGKLAHNAYIATKVSFTNEMEKISHEHGASPADVMHVVWADRRVGSSEHLRPFLGRYDGKCVPKDTKELLNCGGDNILLKAVEEVNSRVPAKNKSEDSIKIVTIIPTRNRIEFLDSALESVAGQRRKPDHIYVVYDNDDPSIDALNSLVSRYSSQIPVSLLRNIHRSCLSGAVNTGLEQASIDYPETESVFVSLLDDDDSWDMSYLLNASKYAEETGADWILSGLIRHDATHPDGIMQQIPQEITAPMFYVSNPNIQGSNLYVRLSHLLAIEGFDENLVSTTDRDVCIRLLRNRTEYAVLNNHLVHHNADDTRSRLSLPGSEKKREGMQAFYNKYSEEMTDSQKTAFKERAKNLFSVIIEDA